jgi:membrane-bound inhibitor of C-type lysozyme
MLRMGILSVLLAALAVLPACAPVRAPAVAYTCEGGVRLDVQFEPERALALLPDGRTVRLVQQVSASGFWYAGEGHVLRGKGREAQWTVGEAAPLACLALGP